MAELKNDFRRIKPADEGMRLDRWIKAHYPAVPHSLLQKLLRTGQVRVNGGRAKPDRRLNAGDEVKVRQLVHLNAQVEAGARKTTPTA